MLLDNLYPMDMTLTSKRTMCEEALHLHICSPRTPKRSEEAEEGESLKIGSGIPQVSMDNLYLILKIK